MTANESQLYATSLGYKSLKDFDLKEARDWVHCRVKGEIGEIVVEEMFKSMGFITERCGMQYQFRNLLSKMNKQTDEISMGIRKHPDLLVINPKRNTRYYIDVKFRADGKMTKERIEDNPYDDAYIVLLSPYHIKCALLGEIKNGSPITGNKENYLGDREEFNFTIKHKRIIHHYREMMANIFDKLLSDKNK